ncbi:MAG: hypothetical protein LBE38_08665 [Deltaproteobacteria bacterium]|jgi:single-stranded DNA-binding protein|nr:hypothetical protein [Deltaproteobacteria bacterium]
MSFGFTMHLICGRIGSAREIETESGRQAVAISLCAKVYPPKDGADHQWYDLTLWGKQALSFQKLGFVKGDEIAITTTNLRPSLWKDKSGVQHSTLQATIERFWDVRSGRRKTWAPNRDQDDNYPDYQTLEEEEDREFQRADYINSLDDYEVAAEYHRTSDSAPMDDYLSAEGPETPDPSLDDALMEGAQHPSLKKLSSSLGAKRGLHEEEGARAGDGDDDKDLEEAEGLFRPR